MWATATKLTASLAMLIHADMISKVEIKNIEAKNLQEAAGRRLRC